VAKKKCVSEPRISEGCTNELTNPNFSSIGENNRRPKVLSSS
ncbi:unnamed protein product, partial [Allacma fusca]